MDGPDPFAAARRSADAIAARASRAHDVAVVLGSGWSGVADRLAATASAAIVDIPMAEVPGFPLPGVRTHRALVRSLDMAGRGVLVLAGRVHLYEGRTPGEVVHGVRTAAALGCSTLVVTNAAGAIDPHVAIGTPVLISDHLNLTGRNPIVGLPDGPGTPRFPDLTHAYDPALRALARRVEPSLAEGVYAGLLGPSFETPAEIGMLRTLGADLVGMSTVLEVIAAAQLGLRVLGLSLVTNAAAGTTAAPVAAADVFAAAEAAVPRLAALLLDLLRAVPAEPGAAPAGGAGGGGDSRSPAV